MQGRSRDPRQAEKGPNLCQQYLKKALWAGSRCCICTFCFRLETPAPSAANIAFQKISCQLGRPAVVPRIHMEARPTRQQREGWEGVNMAIRKWQRHAYGDHLVTICQRHCLGPSVPSKSVWTAEIRSSKPRQKTNCSLFLVMACLS